MSMVDCGRVSGGVRRFLFVLLLTVVMVFTEGCGMPSDGQAEELYQAILDEDTELVRELAEDHRLLNRPRITNPLMRLSDADNRYPLQVACYTSAELADILLEEGADVNVVDPYIGSTPLIDTLNAYYPERFETAFKLIGKGADINRVDENRRTAINSCVLPSRRDTDEAKDEQMRLLEYLLEHCDLEAVARESGSNPLIKAAAFGNKRALEFLAQSKRFGIDDMPGGYTALMVAAGMGKTEVCGILLGYGADPDIKSSKGLTAAEYARQNGHPETAEFLESEREGISGSLLAFITEWPWAETRRKSSDNYDVYRFRFINRLKIFRSSLSMGAGFVIIKLLYYFFLSTATCAFYPGHVPGLRDRHGMHLKVADLRCGMSAAFFIKRRRFYAFV